jgi:hypothetical protein
VENVENSIFPLYLKVSVVENFVDFLWRIFLIKKVFLFSTILIIIIVTILIMGELPLGLLSDGEGEI